jgi:TolB-like protein
MESIMKNYLTPVMIVLFISLIFQIGIAQEFQKTNIAVIDLNSHGGLTQSEISSLSDRLRSLLVRTNAFDVVDRGQMEEILKEQGFQMSGCTSAECAVEAGQILGVEEMITGSIGKIGRLYTIDIVLIDVETARIIKSITRDYQGEIEGLVALMQSITNELSGLQKSPPPPAQKTRITVNSNPNNSEVYIDNRLIGKTPINQHDISPGEHQLKIQKSGYAPHEEKINIEAGKTKPYSIGLKKIFTLKINSVPADAEVYVNGKKVGVTPFSSSGIEDARLEITLQKTNYKSWEKTITLSKNKELDAKMQITDEYKDYLAKQTQGTKVKKEGSSKLWWWLGGGAIVAGTAAYFLISGDDGGGEEANEFPEPPGRP